METKLGSDGTQKDVKKFLALNKLLEEYDFRKENPDINVWEGYETVLRVTFRDSGPKLDCQVPQKAINLGEKYGANHYDGPNGLPTEIKFFKPEDFDFENFTKEFQRWSLENGYTFRVIHKL